MLRFQSAFLPSVLALLLFSTHANASDDPVNRCRATHADDAQGRIACLEAALIALVGNTHREATTHAADDPDLPSGLGAEQVIARLPAELKAKSEKQEPEIAQLKIKEIVYDNGRRAIFFMDNGQVWRESSADRPGGRLRTNREYVAEIKRSGFGGYRMNIDGVRRLLKVERVQ